MSIILMTKQKTDLVKHYGGRPIPEMVKKLRKAVDFLEHGWCQKIMAKDKHGKPIEPSYAKACRWCAAGSLFAAHGYRVVTGIEENLHIQQCINAIKSVVPMGEHTFYSWNDRHGQTKQKVIDAFNKTIDHYEKVA